MPRTDPVFRMVGRKIQKLDLRPFDDGRGGEAYDPDITLDDGTRIRFVVQETEGGDYGVKIIVVEPRR